MSGALMKNASKKPRCDVQELTSRAARGEKEMLDDLVRCFESSLLRFGKRYCGNDEDAKEALQDAYEAATRHLGGFQGLASIKTWMTRLLMSACARRKRGRRNNPSIHRSLDLTPAQESRYLSHGSTPDEDLARHEILSVLDEALKGLSETDRMILLLRDGEGLSAVETSSLVSLTVPAVKSRLHRARKRVQEALEHVRPELF